MKYIIAHEVVHTFTKRHPDRFWEIAKTIYPNFEREQDLLKKKTLLILDLSKQW